MKRRHLLKLGLGTGAALGISGIGKAASHCGIGTPPQTEGPFYPVTDQEDLDWDLTVVRGGQQRAQGEEIIIIGQVTDLNCQPIAGTLVEIWQACVSGKYNHPNDPNRAPLDPHFQYWGKSFTNEQGRYLFKTIIPGAYPATATWMRPPHIHFKVHKWGFAELTTQLYFADHQFNAGDRILQQLSKEEQTQVVCPIEKKEFVVPGEPNSVRSVVEFNLTLKVV